MSILAVANSPCIRMQRFYKSFVFTLLAFNGSCYFVHIVPYLVLPCNVFEEASD